MRQIKFRAWHEAHNEMVNFNNNKLCNDEYQRLFICKLMRGDFGDVLMQFTGLQDKNGVDIYESDLIKVWHEGAAAKGVGTVIFSHDYVGGWVLSTNNNDGLNIGTRTDYIEVVGNIHQPELLEQDNESR